MVPTDRDFFKILIGMFVVPVLYFLGVLLMAGTGYAIWRIADNPSDIVLAAVLFVLGYNAIRYGWILRA